MNITEDIISPYSRLLLAEGRRIPTKNRKLMASHLGLKDHLISLDLLQLLLSLVLKSSVAMGYIATVSPLI